MLTFTLNGKTTGSGLGMVVKKTVAVRNESDTSKDSKAQGPAQLQDDLCKALERLKLTRVSRFIAQHAFATSTGPAYISARGDGEQFALATNYINTHFIDDYSTPAGYQLATQAVQRSDSYLPAQSSAAVTQSHFQTAPGSQPPQPPQQFGLGQRPCFSCIHVGHFLRHCPDVAELVSAGNCHWNAEGRWFHPGEG
jgi:hypothetical protein